MAAQITVSHAEVGDLGGGVDRLDPIGHENRLYALEAGVERDCGGQEQAEGAFGGGHARLVRAPCRRPSPN